NPAPSASYPLSLHDALPIFLIARFGKLKEGVLRDFRIGVLQVAEEVEQAMNPVPGVKGECPLDVIHEDGRLDGDAAVGIQPGLRSEEHTSELQSRENLVCRL